VCIGTPITVKTVSVLDQPFITNRTWKKLTADCDRNLWLEANEAVEYGLADEILQKAPVVSPSSETTEQ